MIEGGKSETVLLINNAFINGVLGSIIGGKVSYFVSRVSALFSLLSGTVGIMINVIFNDGAFILLLLFWLVSVGWKTSQGFGGGRLGNGRFALAPAASAPRNFEKNWAIHMPSRGKQAYKKDLLNAFIKNIWIFRDKVNIKPCFCCWRLEAKICRKGEELRDE